MRNLNRKWGVYMKKNLSIKSPSLVCSLQRRRQYAPRNAKRCGVSVRVQKNLSTLTAQHIDKVTKKNKIYAHPNLLRQVLTDTTNFYDYAFVSKRY